MAQRLVRAKARIREAGLGWIQDGTVEATLDLPGAVLTSITAWRYWDWDVANDRDYTGIPIQSIQRIPSRQDQYSQEFRIASNGNRTLDYVTGLYFFTQTIDGKPIHECLRDALRHAFPRRTTSTQEQN